MFSSVHSCHLTNSSGPHSGCSRWFSSAQARFSPSGLQLLGRSRRALLDPLQWKSQPAGPRFFGWVEGWCTLLAVRACLVRGVVWRRSDANSVQIVQPKPCWGRGGGEYPHGFCILYQPSFLHLIWFFPTGHLRSGHHVRSSDYLLKSLWCYSSYSF